MSNPVQFTDATYNAIADLGNALSNATPDMQEADNLTVASSAIHRLQFEDQAAMDEVTEQIEQHGYESVVKAAADIFHMGCCG